MLKRYSSNLVLVSELSFLGLWGLGTNGIAGFWSSSSLSSLSSWVSLLLELFSWSKTAYFINSYIFLMLLCLEFRCSGVLHLPDFFFLSWAYSGQSSSSLCSLLSSIIRLLSLIDCMWTEESKERETRYLSSESTGISSADIRRFCLVPLIQES